MGLSECDETCDETAQLSAIALIMQELSVLDAEAKGLKATEIREFIADAIGDLACPAGKDSAYLAIPKIRKMLDVHLVKFSVCPPPTIDEVASA